MSSVRNAPGESITATSQPSAVLIAEMLITKSVAAVGEVA